MEIPTSFKALWISSFKDDEATAADDTVSMLFYR